MPHLVLIMKTVYFLVAEVVYSVRRALLLGLASFITNCDIRIGCWDSANQSAQAAGINAGGLMIFSFTAPPNFM